MARHDNAGTPPMTVGIGLVRRSGAFLVRRRPPGAPLEGRWEFPGGKCEPGESAEQAACRECAEETGLAVRVVALRHRVAHDYPHGRVELYYYDCETTDPAARPDPSSGFLWVAASEFPSLTFPEANAPVVAELVRDFGNPG
jgi:mutator protein MutT